MDLISVCLCVCVCVCVEVSSLLNYIKFCLCVLVVLYLTLLLFVRIYECYSTSSVRASAIPTIIIGDSSFLSLFIFEYYLGFCIIVVVDVIVIKFYMKTNL